MGSRTRSRKRPPGHDAMRIFFSAGEPSGDVHGGNLIRQLSSLDPGLETVGYGGDRMEAAGCKLHFPLSQLAVIGFTRIFASLPKFLSLASQADRYFRHQRPDAVVLIDFPGFNWWIARRAKFHKIPVFYFVPPQLWAWAGWRVKKVQRFVDHVLCSLPFERDWYAERGVDAHYVGHPFFDEVPSQRLDPAFLEQHRSRPGPIVALLPGSRTQEIEGNTATLVRAARKIHDARPDVRFLAACYKPHQQKWVDEYLKKHPGTPIETFVGRTPEIIELAHSCLSVSGSVSLELLHRNKPTCVLYRVKGWEKRLFHRLKKVDYISLVNLLAGRELYPEYLTDRCEAEALAGNILTWLGQPQKYDRLRADLKDLRDAVARPGACERTAQYILNELSVSRVRTAA